MAKQFTLFSGLPSAERSTRRWGFSLTEIMITLSLFLILAGLGVGAYFNYYSVSTLNHDIARVATLIEQTQFKALKNPYGQPYGIYINPGTMELTSFRNSYVPGNSENIILKLEQADSIELALSPSPGITNQILFEAGTGKTQNFGYFSVGNLKQFIVHSFVLNAQGAIE